MRWSERTHWLFDMDGTLTVPVHDFVALRRRLGAPEGGDILAMTTALNAFVEAEVRARPGHWLWMHQRFKPVATLSPRAARLSRQGGE